MITLQKQAYYHQEEYENIIQGPIYSKSMPPYLNDNKNNGDCCDENDLFLRQHFTCPMIMTPPASPNRKRPLKSISCSSKVLPPRVQFADRCQFYPPTVSKEDLSTMWYNQSDLDGFQKEKKKTIRAMKYVKGHLTRLRGTKYITRGLEQYQTSQFNRMCKMRRYQVQRAVLMAQRDRQPVCQASQQQSQWAVHWAQQLARQDEQDIRQVEDEFFAMSDDNKNNTTDNNEKANDENDNNNNNNKSQSPASAIIDVPPLVSVTSSSSSSSEEESD